jgi:hypothetical protein
MLRKGEMSRSIRTRKERSHLSVQALHKLLSSFQARDKKVPADVVAACASQGSLARFSKPDLSIRAMSINTLKSAADAVVQAGKGGWVELDSIRRAIWKNSQKPRSLPSSISKLDRVRGKNRDLNIKLDQERRARASLVRAYTELLSITRAAARREPELERRLARHLKTFGEIGFHQVSTEQKND